MVATQRSQAAISQQKELTISISLAFGLPVTMTDGWKKLRCFSAWVAIMTLEQACSFWWENPGTWECSTLIYRNT
jgi:hypothetical protein